MNVFEKIESDHEKIRSLIADLEAAPDAGARQARFNSLRDFLRRHHDSEQDTFFNELVQHDKSREKALHLVEEHGEHKKLLEQMDELSPVADDWDDRFDELKHDVLHHIEEEEEDAFKLGRAVLSDQVATDLGARMGHIQGGLASPKT